MANQQSVVIDVYMKSGEPWADPTKIREIGEIPILWKSKTGSGISTFEIYELEGVGTVFHDLRSPNGGKTWEVIDHCNEGTQGKYSYKIRATLDDGTKIDRDPILENEPGG